MKVVVTSGATREPIDSVRFISNLSSGRTGAMICEALAARGFQVTQVAGVESVQAGGVARRETFTDDGYYPTGDVGRLDADGFLTLTGRCDDMFKVRGATVYPSEVETALHSIAGVRRAFVVDVVRGGTAEVAAAVVVEPDGAPTVDELDRAVRARLSSFKVPTRWALVDADSVPRTATGKPDKAGLQELFE